MSDVHVLFLKCRLDDREALHRLVEEGVLRASALTVGGSYEGIGVGTYSALSSDTGTRRVGQPEASTEGAVSSTSVEDAYALVCPSDDRPPCNLALLQVVRGTVSHMEPREFIAFVLLQVNRGRVREVAARLRELSPADGVDEAVALAHGTAGVDAVVELVSDDLDALHERMLAFTDLEDVVSHQVLYTSAARTRGFGAGARATSD